MFNYSCIIRDIYVLDVADLHLKDRY